MIPTRTLRKTILTMKCATHRDGIRLAILFLIIPFTGLEASGFSFHPHQQGREQQSPIRHHQLHSDGPGGGSRGGGYPTEMTVKPHIESVKYNNITVFVGQTAYLPCVVKHLGDKTVSWIRKKDLHILTSGTHIYTSNPRVSLLREGKLLNSWTLKLSSVNKADEASYECQVNTEPKLTITLHLIVIGSPDDEQGGALALGMLDLPQHQRDSSLDSFSKGYEARILGPGHVLVHQGQAVNLTCLVSHGGPSPNITWFLNDIPLEKTSNTRGGINMETEKSPFTTVSKLVIVRVDRRDEGRYSCGGITVYPDSVVVRVMPLNSRSEHGSDKAMPMMVSVASSASRAVASSSQPFSFLAVFPLSSRGLGVINNHLSSHHAHYNPFPCNELLPTLWTNFPRHNVFVFVLSFITCIFHYQTAPFPLFAE